MDSKSLTKQLCLMYNIALTYPQKIETKEWNEMRNLFETKRSYLDSVINSEEKEKVRTKAREASNRLSSILILKSPDEIECMSVGIC